jgi:hypothetical protein
MAKKAKDEKRTHTITITVWDIDAPIEGDEFMQVESTSDHLPDDPSERALQLALEIIVAAGIQIGNVAKSTLELAALSTPVIQAFLLTATKRLEELHPGESQTSSPEKLGIIAEKLGISENELQEMKTLLNQKIM